ncbi:spore maturation protein [Candidatus Epulonipiscium viviparus]|uniref:spore maturation protein n=1 Tax=Candidatus Epulonipiscium viviparus TaxID=420336 RepID=UPI0004984090|nr:nucleoside recognition domain-containing protein [Candidatus Epulopiscium viviparus]
MSILMHISDYIIPSVCIFIISYGLFKKVDVFEVFIEGATEGLNVAIKILPTLIALLVAVGMLRSSGVLDGIVKILSPIITSFTDFPPEVVPIALMRTVSSSASTGLILDIFKNYGPDSFMGRLVSIMFACTETIFYTMSVYFMTINIKDTRYTLSGSLLATLAGIIASYLITVSLFGI